MNRRYVIRILSALIVVSLPGAVQSRAGDLDTRLGTEVAAQVEAQMGLAEHKRASAYVDKIGQRLVSNLEDRSFEYQFRVVDMAEPNAFALPGGFVYFSRGILLIANSEDELAGVMGHEIIHSHKRHSVKSMKRSLRPGILKIPGNVAGAVVSPRLGRLMNAPVDSVTGLTLARYGRAHESESDRLGAELAARSGYDPRALGDILTNLSGSVEIVSGKREKFSYRDSHPFTPDRVGKINRISKDLKVAPIPPVTSGKREFLDQFQGLIIGDSPSQGIFQESRFIHPGLGFALEFPKGWKTYNSPKNVGAHEPGKEAQLHMGIADGKGTPEEQAGEVIRVLKKKFRAAPSESRKVDVNGNPGYYLSLKDSSGKEPATIHMLWLTMGEHTFEFIGAGTERHRAALREAVLSLHPITEEERSNLTVKVFRVVEAEEGETLASLGLRSGNALGLEITAAINDLSLDQKLSEGQLVKTGKKEPWRNPEQP